MKRIVLLITFVFINGCSPSCQQDSIAGSYELKSASGLLVLTLNKDGSAKLLRNRSLISNITWDWVSANEQVFLNVSRDVWEVLRAASDGVQLPADVPYIENLHHGVVPVCGPGGVPDRLNLDLEGRYYFTRTAG